MMGGFDGLIDDLRNEIRRAHPDLATHFGIQCQVVGERPDQRRVREHLLTQGLSGAMRRKSDAATLNKHLSELGRLTKSLPRTEMSPTEKLKAAGRLLNAVMLKAQVEFEAGRLSGHDLLKLQFVGRARIEALEASFA